MPLVSFSFLFSLVLSCDRAASTDAGWPIDSDNRGAESRDLSLVSELVSEDPLESASIGRLLGFIDVVSLEERSR